MTDGRLPWQFALSAGIGDVATGVVAIIVAAMLAQKADGARREVYAWCLIVIADLVVAVTTFTFRRFSLRERLRRTS
jgi:hypothetical protein